MYPKIDIITLGVADLQRARDFYEHGFGCALEQETRDTVTVNFGRNASALALRPWDALAGEAGVAPQTNGFRGFTLSYIVDSADDVDDVLARAAGHGAEISKPPRNAMWGYSAYLTDPSGYLWKVASSKRRPLIGRTRSAPSGSDHADRPVEAQEVPLTIGVADMKRAKQFYKDGLGLPVKKDYRKFVMFSGQDGTSDLGMYKWEALADDAAVPAAGDGFRGFTITHVVDSAAGVDALLNRAARAGGQVDSPGVAAGGAYSGYFTDPDGYLWSVAARIPDPPSSIRR
ncbi:MAG TPA: VOC family protein [Solirubrobacteraceae bacterium]|jgi:catechol 2,3-dioxygenase-like lactoylglutathione lyase family enzyme